MNNIINNLSDVYCNPIKLPDYPLGICSAFRQTNPEPAGFISEVGDFRELADPEMLFDDGVWYMFPSAAQAYVSKDLINWEYKKLEIDEDLGYAPSIAKVKDRFYLTSSALFRDKKSKIFSAPHPLGPYVNLGEIRTVSGENLPNEFLDPSLFCDDDGRLYLYWGFGPDGGGIYGVELDSEQPTVAISEPKKLIDFNPENRFECFGEYNEHADWSFIEGAAMFKHNGEYYLQYSACGTVFRHYCLGVYRGKSPLGEFSGQKKPMALSPYGMVTGSGHGGWVKGPQESIWQFYTCSFRRTHFFERRIGMDKVTFAPDGSAQVKITSTPQSVTHGDLNLIPVSVNKYVTSSSYANCNYPNFACDDCIHTHWAPRADDIEPFIELNFRKEFTVEALRICWAELNLNMAQNRPPEPVKFKVEFFTAEHKKSEVELNLCNNETDYLIDFQTFPPIHVQFAKLTIFDHGKIRHGVTEFTVFGRR